MDTPKPIDVDALPDSLPLLDTSITAPCISPEQARSCSGIYIQIPAGKSAHSLYPFVLHKSLGDLWDYSVTAGKFNLRSRACELWLDKPQQIDQCEPCRDLSSNPNIIGIIDRMQDGVHSSTPFHYYGVGGLITVLRAKTGDV